jgi:hypothetical protein
MKNRTDGTQDELARQHNLQEHSERAPEQQENERGSGTISLEEEQTRLRPRK